MEQLYQIKAILINSIQDQLSNLAQADTHELGEVIDMIKDISEAMYYCSMVESTRKKGFLNGSGASSDMDMYNYARGGGSNSGGGRGGNYMYTMNTSYREPYADGNRMMPPPMG